MCLIVKPISYDPFANSDEIFIYKVLRENLTSPYYNFKYKEGENIAEGEVDKEKKRIEGGGLHVLMTKNDAEIEKSNLLYFSGLTTKIFRLRGKKEDLIAVGDFEGKNSAAFTKLYFYQEDQIDVS